MEVLWIKLDSLCYQSWILLHEFTDWTLLHEFTAQNLLVTVMFVFIFAIHIYKMNEGWDPSPLVHICWNNDCFVMIRLQYIVNESHVSVTQLHLIVIFPLLIFVTQFEATTFVAHNNIEQTLTFQHSLFTHFAQETNEIWYPGRPVNAPPKYQFTFYIKWPNSKRWKVSICSKLLCATSLVFKNLGHIFHITQTVNKVSVLFA